MITFVRVLTQPHPLAVSLSFFQTTLYGMVRAVCPARVVSSTILRGSPRPYPAQPVTTLN